MTTSNPSRRLFPRVMLGAVALVLAAILVEMIRSAIIELKLDFRPARTGLETPRDPAGMQTINLAALGEDALTAFYLPARNGRMIVLLHGSGADRTQLLPEARMLARHGFGILNLDFPGHGGSAGEVHWDEPERAAARRALSWAAEQPNVDGQNLGIFGFSMGAWFALQVAVGDPRVKALVLAGAFADVKEALIATKGRHFGWLVEWPTLMAARFQGLHYDERRSVDLIPAVAPRPVLLIAGDRDHDVPADATRRLWEAAQEPKTFWLVPGAGHGEYAEKAPTEYEQRLVRFFADALHAPD